MIISFIQLMKRSILLLILTVAVTPVAFGQSPTTIVSVPELESRIASEEKPLLVINFWATWCGPCIKELPYFEQAYQSREETMHLLLVNLDFADKIDKVNAFATKKGLTGEIVLLDNLDYNSWIDKIDPSWSGAIPATLIINTQTGERLFLEGEMDQPKLESYITQLLP